MHKVARKKNAKTIYVFASFICYYVFSFEKPFQNKTIFAFFILYIYIYLCLDYFNGIVK